MPSWHQPPWDDAVGESSSPTQSHGTDQPREVDVERSGRMGVGSPDVRGEKPVRARGPKIKGSTKVSPIQNRPARATPARG